MAALAATLCNTLADLAEKVPELARSVLKERQGKNSIKTRGLVRASFSSWLNDRATAQSELDCAHNLNTRHVHIGGQVVIRGAAPVGVFHGTRTVLQFLARMTKGWPIFRKNRSPGHLDRAGRVVTQVSDNAALG